MMRPIELDNYLRLFYMSLWQSFLKHKKILIILLAVFCLLSVQYSILFPKYSSETLILVKRLDDPTKIMNHVYNATTNETFLSSQVSILKSRVILEKTFSKFKNEPVTRHDFKKIQSSIAINRFPFNNHLFIKLKWRDKAIVTKMLNELIIVYKNWFRENIIEEAKNLNIFLAKEISKRKSKLDELENKFNDFLKQNEMFSSPDYYNLKIQQFLAEENILNDNLSKKRVIESELIAIQELLDKEIVVKNGFWGDENIIYNLGTKTLNEKIKLLELNYLFEDESIEVINQKNKIKYLEKELISNLSVPFSNNREVLKEKRKELDKKYIRSTLILITVKARIQYYSKLVANNNLLLQKWNYIEVEKNRFKRKLIVKEAAFIELNKRLEKNLDYLAKNNSYNIKYLSSPSMPEKVNTLVKSIFVGCFSAFLTYIIIIYLFVYFGKYLEDEHFFSKLIGKTAIAIIPPIFNLSSEYPLIGKNTTSEFFESFRKLGTTIFIHSQDSTLVHVTSPTLKSGKTLIAVNLAITLANSRAKVLIVDCDQNNYSAFKALSILETGIDKNCRKGQWIKNLRNTEISNLDITNVTIFDESPLEILFNDSLAEIIREMKEKYRFIIFDSLSLLHHTYPLILSKKSDINIFAVKLGVETKKNVIDVHRMVDSLKINNVEWVLNY